MRKLLALVGTLALVVGVTAPAFAASPPAELPSQMPD